MAKTIIITGANGGLGTAVVEKFLTEGYNVIGVSHSERQTNSNKEHPNYEHYVVDVSNEQEAAQFINKVTGKYKTIHGALLLVGAFDMGNIQQTTGNDIKKMFGVNFESAYYVARPLFAHMMEHNYGRIVLISSRPAFQDGGKNAIAYTLSKTLLNKLSELLNETAKGTNVVCSVVVPSTIDTPANRKDMPGADHAKWVQPSEIAGLLEFICSDEAASLRQPVYKIYGNA